MSRQGPLLKNAGQKKLSHTSQEDKTSKKDPIQVESAAASRNVIEIAIRESQPTNRKPPAHTETNLAIKEVKTSELAGPENRKTVGGNVPGAGMTEEKTHTKPTNNIPSSQASEGVSEGSRKFTG